MTPEELTVSLKQRANELGFPLVGVAKASTPERLPLFWRWLENGYAGRMQYLERRHDAYAHPSSILEGCQSLLMLGAPYLSQADQKSPQSHIAGFGKVARYAQSGLDYHHVIRRRLKDLKRWLTSQVPSAKARGVVDTAPILEREFAEAAGLGWIGKNTLLLNRQWGSYFFLAALLTDCELIPDPAHETSHCGSCTACLDRCPTQAFPEPYVLDATRCISYLTIEQSEAVDPELADKTHGWLFGCDICQEVCPWNRKSLVSPDATWQPQHEFQLLDTLRILQLSQEEFDQTYGQTALGRSGLPGLIRNAILVAGWQRWGEATPALIALLTHHQSVIRISAAWALGRIGGEAAVTALQRAIGSETNQEVRIAMQRALC